MAVLLLLFLTGFSGSLVRSQFDGNSAGVPLDTSKFTCVTFSNTVG